MLGQEALPGARGLFRTVGVALVKRGQLLGQKVLHEGEFDAYLVGAVLHVVGHAAAALGIEPVQAAERPLCRVGNVQRLVRRPKLVLVDPAHQMHPVLRQLGQRLLDGQALALAGVALDLVHSNIAGCGRCRKRLQAPYQLLVGQRQEKRAQERIGGLLLFKFAAVLGGFNHRLQPPSRR